MIIGLCGFIGAGKSTVAELISDRFKSISFADSLKDAISAVFGWDRAMLEGDTVEFREFRNTRDVWWSDRLQMDITPRFIMQNWGTELIRGHFHPDMWIAAVERKIFNLQGHNIVITDCRFLNEIEMLKRLGGKLIWVKRGNLPEWYDNYITTGIPPTDVHNSEYLWVRNSFDLIIENDGDINDLCAKCAQI